MKIAVFVFLLVAGLGGVSAADKVRTINDIPGLPTRVLRRTLSSTIYQHILVSPVEGWIAVRGRLSNTHLVGARIAHSELDGAYDKYALQLARETQIAGVFTTGHLDSTAPVILNVLIYEIADGTMALSFPCLERTGGEQKTFYGGARLAVLQINGQWTDLKLPQGPLGRGWAVQTYTGYVKRGFGFDDKLPDPTLTLGSLKLS